MGHPSDKDLLNSIKQNDHAAIKQLFHIHHSSLCSIAYRLLKDRDAAKDIVQDVFIKFWRNRTNIEITSSLQAYLNRSVVNTALNQLEKDKRVTKVRLEDVTAPPISESGDQPHLQRELLQQVHQAIENLPVRTRGVFVLIRNEDMTYKEAALAVNISTKAVEKEMMKALKLLREMLGHVLPLLISAMII